MELCAICGANLAMVGRMHRCIAKPKPEPKPPVKGKLSLKRGRPRLGEVRDKPWLKTVPPMSRATWYRRRTVLKAQSG
jgi:hypothetical protein